MWLPTARTEGPTSRARTSPRQALLPSSRPLPIPLAPASGMRAGPVPLPTAPHERSPKTTFCLAVQPDVIKIATPVAFPMWLSAGHIKGLGTGPAHGRWHKPPARRGEDSGSGHARNQWHNPHAIYAKHPTSGVTPAPARHCFPPPGPCRSRMRPPRACARALSPSLPLPMSVAPKPPSALPFNQMS